MLHPTAFLGVSSCSSPRPRMGRDRASFPSPRPAGAHLSPPGRAPPAASPWPCPCPKSPSPFSELLLAQGRVRASCLQAGSLRRLLQGGLGAPVSPTARCCPVLLAPCPAGMGRVVNLMMFAAPHLFLSAPQVLQLRGPRLHSPAGPPVTALNPSPCDMG